MRTAREWVLAQPGGSDFDGEDLATAIAAVEARDREIIEACARVAESYEPRCDACPRGVATAVRGLAPVLTAVDRVRLENLAAARSALEFEPHELPVADDGPAG